MRKFWQAAIIAAAALAGSGTSAAPITPADIMGLRDMRQVAMSPDGRTVLFTVQDQMATFSSPRSTVWAVPADGKVPARRFIVSAGVDDSPAWAPDGRTIAFLSNRKNPLSASADTGYAFKVDAATTPGAPVDATPPPTDTPGEPSRQLWLIAADGGEAVPLTALPGDIASFAWSPDGKRIAFLSADPESAAQKADRLAKRDAVVVDKPTGFTRLWILDVASHVARRVSPPGLNVSAVDWAPNGRELALRVGDATSINTYFYHSRIVRFDIATGQVGATLLDHAGEGPHWSPDGRSIAAAEILTPGFIGAELRVIDVATGRVSDPAPNHPGLISKAAWSRDGRSLQALSFERTRSKLVRIAGGRVTTVAVLDGEASDLSTSADGGRVAVALSSPDRPADVWTVTGGTARAVTRINPQVATWQLGQVREISWQNSKDGRTIYGVLVTPPGHVAGTPARMVVQLHGGPEWAWWSGWLGSWHEWAQLLASHGYVVFLPNPRGSDGQGSEFARTLGGDWGGMDYQDVVDGVDTLVAQKVADPARLGIGGWSYGGFLSAWAVTHDRRFKAAVVGAAPVDLSVMARITDTPDFTLGYLGDVTTNAAAYDLRSPIRLVDRVAAPVLVLHGGQDTRVPPTLGLQFYRGLKMLGRDVEMVRYPREPHWLHEPAHQEDLQRRVLAFFDKHL